MTNLLLRTERLAARMGAEIERRKAEGGNVDYCMIRCDHPGCPQAISMSTIAGLAGITDGWFVGVDAEEGDGCPPHAAAVAERVR